DKTLSGYEIFSSKSNSRRKNKKIKKYGSSSSQLSPGDSWPSSKPQRDLQPVVNSCWFLEPALLVSLIPLSIMMIVQEGGIVMGQINTIAHNRFLSYSQAHRLVWDSGVFTFLERVSWISTPSCRSQGMRIHQLVEDRENGCS